MDHKTFLRDEVIFRAGSYAETMYEITAGKVGIYARYGTPEQQELAILGEGQIFGEMGLVEYYARSATAVALEDATAVDEISNDDFMMYFRDQPDKVLSIMRQLSSRLRETNAKYTEACRTVCEAIEAEKAGERRGKDLRSRLTGLIRQITRRD